MKVFKLGRGIAWLDMGDPDRLNAASNFVRSVQINQGFLISCLEEISLNNGWIDKKDIEKNLKISSVKTEYNKYVKNIIDGN